MVQREKDRRMRKEENLAKFDSLIFYNIRERDRWSKQKLEKCVQQRSIESLINRCQIIRWNAKYVCDRHSLKNKRICQAIRAFCDNEKLLSWAFCEIIQFWVWGKRKTEKNVRRFHSIFLRDIYIEISYFIYLNYETSQDTIHQDSLHCAIAIAMPMYLTLINRVILLYMFRV